MTYNGETPYSDGAYTVQKFLQSGSFITPSGVTEADEICLVAGGGAGGTWVGGGGGAGGVRVESGIALSGTMAVVIGDGGAAPTANGAGDDGDDSTFAGYTAKGGGGGGWYNNGGNMDGRPGGSGGGGAWGVGHGAGGAGTTGQGTDGAMGAPADAGGGGGGASAAAYGDTGGAGTDFHGTTYGGGGGGAGPSGGAGGAGGAGGGGHGSDHSTTSKTATDGTPNTGGGGGGAWYAPYSSFGGAGGSGVLIIRYLTPGVPTTQLPLTSGYRTRSLHPLDLLSKYKTHRGPHWRLTLRSAYSTSRLPPVQVASVALASLYRTGKRPDAVRSTLLSAFGTHSLTRGALASAYRTVSVHRVRLTLAGRYRTGHATTLTLHSLFATEWRGREPGDVRTVFEVNGINLNDGVHTFVQPGANLGAEEQQYDLILHYDASLRQHNVHGVPVQMNVPVKFVFATAPELSSFVDGVRESIKGGGYAIWQDGGDELGEPEYFKLLQDTSPEPQRDFAYRKRNVAIYTLTMMRFPR